MCGECLCCPHPYHSISKNQRDRKGGGHDLHYILYSFTKIQILYKITEGGYMAMVNRNETKVGC